MRLNDLLVATRLVLDDAPDPVLCQADVTEQQALWSDEELIVLARQAYLDAIIRINGKLDSSEDFASKITVIAGTGSYPVDEAVLQITRVMLAGNRKPLSRETLFDLDKLRSGWETAIGAPTHYVESLDRHQIQLYPIPDVDGLLTLTVRRMPENMRLRGNDDLSLLPEQSHYGLVYLICAMAYQKQDSDTLDIRRVDYFESLAERYFGERKSINAQEHERDYTQKRVRIGYFA